MGNFMKQQDRIREVKEKEKTSRETLGKFFYDLAKLTFAVMTLAGGVSLILEETQLKQVILLMVGIITTTIFTIIGYNILKR